MLDIKDIFLIAVIVLQSILHYCERRDLYNRIMSKDLSEYKKNDKLPPPIPSAHDRVLNKWRNKAGDR